MEPTLYILMRDDLASLNPGKAIAQATHATNQFERVAAEARQSALNDITGTAFATLAVQTWREGRDFGRCLTVAAKPWQIEKIVELASESDYFADKVVDPTYPLLDGEVVHHIELMTCGWAFVWEASNYADKQVISELKRLSLYK